MLAVLLAFGLVLATTATSASTPLPTLAIDPAQSQVQFSVRKFWLAHVSGTFPQLHGSLRRTDNRAGPGLGVVDAELAVDGLQMDGRNERAHALGPHFFDAARFPLIRFHSDPFPLQQLVTGGTLRGLLTLHGKRHPVTLSLLPSDCPRQPLVCVVRARGTISRSAFGMQRWRGILGDKVKLKLRIKLRNPPLPGS